ncbi:MAG TPA: BBP7 family outer membrane beta-barrel protein [Gemmataceae bacterium]|nr:BBP7 family outer membrane beta-barrel protein [Gemmataceae bacterium]
MANGWKIAAILMLAALAPAQVRAQFLFFGKKKPADDPPPAFSSGPAPQDPQFAPDPKSVPKDAPQFCPPPGSDPHTPFVPVEEENRNAFLDYKTSEPAPLMLWFKADYLLWHLKRENMGAILVTTDTAPNSSTDFGALGQAHTVVLLGNNDFSNGTFNGGRLTAGFCPGFLMPIEVSAFAMQHSRSLFTASSLGGSNDPVLARPVFASQGGGESVFLGGFPGLAAGDISVIANTNLWGLDANAYFGVVDTDVLNVDFFLGYRYQELRENVLIFNSLTALDSLVIPFNDTVPGVSTVNRYDQFGTQNRFNGGQLGMRSALHFGRVALMLDGKLALGETRETINIFGTSSSPNAETAFRGLPVSNGGVLAVPSNSGIHSKQEFGYIPEVDLNLGFQVTRSVRLFSGISWMYWNHVVRPGDQITNVIDTRQVPTSNFFNSQSVTQPPFPFHKTDFYAYGFNFGILIGF